MRTCSRHKIALETTWGDQVLLEVQVFCLECLKEEERETGGRCAGCDARYYWPEVPVPADPWPEHGGKHLCWRCAPSVPEHVCENHPDQVLLGSGYLVAPMGGWCPQCHLEAERRIGARCAGCGARHHEPPPPALAPSWPAHLVDTPEGVVSLHYCPSCFWVQTGRAPHALAGALDLGADDLASAAEGDAPTSATLGSPPAAEALSSPPHPTGTGQWAGGAGGSFQETVDVEQLTFRLGSPKRDDERRHQARHALARALGLPPLAAHTAVALALYWPKRAGRVFGLDEAARVARLVELSRESESFVRLGWEGLVALGAIEAKLVAPDQERWRLVPALAAAVREGRVWQKEAF